MYSTADHKLDRFLEKNKKTHQLKNKQQVFILFDILTLFFYLNREKTLHIILSFDFEMTPRQNLDDLKASYKNHVKALEENLKRLDSLYKAQEGLEFKKATNDFSVSLFWKVWNYNTKAFYK